MTTKEDFPHALKIGFTPSLEEQLLLPKVHNHNSLIIYSTEDALVRVQSLIILFYLNQSSPPKPSRVLILTKRSTQQKFQTLLKTHLTQLTTVLNGSILPNARKLDYNRYSIIFSTPRTTQNDLNDKFFPANHFSLLLINQAELGASSRSLRYLVNKLVNSRIVGFSQVTNLEKLKHSCENLQVKEVIQLEELPSVAERSNIQHYSIPLPKEYFFILDILDQIQKHELEDLRKLGFNVSPKSNYREIAAIHESLKEESNLKLLVRTGNLLRILTLRKIIISQGFAATLDYFDSLKLQLEKEQNFQGKQSIIVFLGDIKIQKLHEYLVLHKHLQHPKSQMILKLISEYKSGVSITTHNYYNASFLKAYLRQQGVSVIQVENPITSLTQLNLERALSPFTESKTSVCITNTVNEMIARNAKVIIAYDVNADIVETLNNLPVDIPKVFLLAKQTNEEARFFYLKRLGAASQNQVFDPNVLNANLNQSKNGMSKKDPGASKSTVDEDLSDPSVSLVYNKSLFELGIPYLFSKTEYSISSNDDFSFPGFILDQRICFLILVPSTIDFLISTNLPQFFTQLKNEYEQVHLILFSQSMENLSFDFQCDILHTANQHNVWISLLGRDEDIPKLVNRVIHKAMYK